MTLSLKQKVISGLAALTIGAGMLTASVPAQAKPFHGHGGAIAAGVIGGLALGAIAASAAAAQPVYVAPAYGGPVYYGSTCYKTKQPVTDVYGNVMYYQVVKACH